MTLDSRLRTVAGDLANFRASSKDVTGPLGYLIGATYSLLRALELGYQHGDVEDEAYASELREVANSLAERRSPAQIRGLRILDPGPETLVGIWLGGFYFNSSLHRIAAAAERLGVHPKKGDAAEPPVVARVRRDVNKLKHLIKDCGHGSKGLLAGREVESVAVAFDAIEALIELSKNKGIL